MRVRLRILAIVALSIAALTATAFACGWMGTSNSVRFDGYQTERDMGRLPPLPTSEVTWEADGSDYDYAKEQAQVNEIDNLWERSQTAAEEGKLVEVRSLLKEYLEETTTAGFRYNLTDRQQRRNTAIDLLDALSALDHGSNPSRVQAYLKARRSHDDNVEAEVQIALKEIGNDVRLKDNATYLRAAQLYQQGKHAEAAREFSAVARRYPQSEKREAALFMTAVATMKTSMAFTPTSGDEAHLHEYDSEDARHPVEIDKPWREALAGFQSVMMQYPRGRYFDDARGWKAYLLLRKGDRAGALVEYYRLLADKRNRTTQIDATFSLGLVRHHASDEEMARVERQIAGEPEVALAYAYYNIYNYSIDLENDSPPYEEVKDWKGNYDAEASQIRNDELEAEWRSKREKTTRDQLTRIVAFSRRLMDRYPTLRLGGAFALRASQASLELDQNENAAQFSRRALQSQLNAEERLQALWVLGVAEHRLEHFGSARESLNTLLRDYPNSELTEGARRHLAMSAEDSGDIDGALEQYIALDYTVDVAYFVDVLMTKEQLAGFIDRHPESPKLNELKYALGVRYLRSNQWDLARAAFAKVQTTAATERVSWSIECQNNGTQCLDPKEGDGNEYTGPLITTRLVMHDVQTANDMEALERAVEQANDPEAKAEAMYQLASYQYEASSLLFYNPVAWSGQRYWNISYLATEDRFRAPNEPQILFAYMQEHDTLARALKIYLEVVDKFPNTRAARDSLYTAAVCHERLANYNEYWREMYGAGLHAGKRLVTYTNVRGAYPSYQLPRGTSGWQPSTRTVNDGPGWAAPPKKIPRPSRAARLKLLLESFINPILVFWSETGRRGLSLLTILVAMGLTARIATQNRKLLRPKLLRVRTRNAQEAPVDQPPAEMFWTDPRDELWQRTKRLVGKWLIEFWLLAQDTSSRPILFRNILSHSFLVGLIVSLLWTLHYG